MKDEIKGIPKSNAAHASHMSRVWLADIASYRRNSGGVRPDFLAPASPAGALAAPSDCSLADHRPALRACPGNAFARAGSF